MYRHEKTPENTTALEGVIQGFAEDPSSIFQNEMRKVAEEMKDLPFYRKDIDCYCPKFVLFENQWIGTVDTLDVKYCHFAWQRSRMGTARNWR